MPVRKLFRGILLGISGLALLLLLFYLLAGWYISSHRNSLYAKLSDAASASISGTLDVGNMDFSLWRHFPNLSIIAHNISIRDSAYTRHGHELLHAGEVEMSLGWNGLFRSSLGLRSVRVRDVQIDMYTDSTNYKNYLVFKKAGNSSGQVTIALRKVTCTNVEFLFDDRFLGRRHDLTITSLYSNFHSLPGHIDATLHGIIGFHQLGFDLQKGSFLREQTADVDFRLDWSDAGKILHVDSRHIRIGGHPYAMQGNFYFNEFPPHMDLVFSSDRVTLPQTYYIVNEKLQRVLEKIPLAGNLTAWVRIHGIMQFRVIPFTQVSFTMDNGTLTLNDQQIQDIAMRGAFMNYIDTLKARDATNSLLSINSLSAQYNGIPLTLRAMVSDLRNPYLDIHAASEAPLLRLNPLASKVALRCTSGNFSMQLHYTGKLIHAKSGFLPVAHVTLSGALRVVGGALHSTRKNVAVRDLNIGMHMEPGNSTVDYIYAYCNGHLLSGAGRMQSTLSKQGFPTEQITLAVKADTLDLRGFFERAKKITPQIDKQETTHPVQFLIPHFIIALQSGVVRLPGIEFRNMEGTIDADAGAIRASQFRASLLGGSASWNASYAPDVHQLQLDARMLSLDISAIYALVKDKESELSPDDLRGSLSGSIAVKATVNPEGGIMRKSLYGTSLLNLHNITIRNLGDMLNLPAFAGGKNLALVQFNDVRDTLHVRGNNIRISAVTLASDQFTVFVSGSYNLVTGPDFVIRLPLNSLGGGADAAKNNNTTEEKSGMNLYFHLTRRHGKTHIALDPFIAKPGKKEKSKR